MAREVISEDPKIIRVEGSNGEVHEDLIKKLLAQNELPLLGKIYRDHGYGIVFTSGTYDMVHIGHGRYLDKAKSLGDILVVGLNSDVSVRSYKGPDRPILGEMKRAEMLSYFSSVNFIVMYDEPDASNIIRLLKPHKCLIVEGSWPEGTRVEDKPEVVAMAEHGGEIYVSPRQAPHLSTSTIIEHLERGGEQRALNRLSQMLEAVKSGLPNGWTL